MELWHSEALTQQQHSCTRGRNRHRGGAEVRRYPGLHHLAAGAVSISLNGEEVAITLAKALSLDSSHQARARGTTMRGLALLRRWFVTWDAWRPAALCSHECLHVIIP